MAQVTPTDVFDFMGTETSVRTANTAAVQTLIDNHIKDIEATIGRRIEKEDITDELFEDGLNCQIHQDFLFLSGNFRDLFSITTLKENNVTLTAVADSNDGNDFYLDNRRGIIRRVNQSWSFLPSAIKITGSLGLVDQTTPFDTKADIKQILTEMTAAKSGLWKINVETEGGSITTIKTTINRDTRQSLKKYILRDV